MKLIDKFGRTIDYLRISVTDRCNLRCVYCMPEEGVENIPHDEILRYEEILKIVDVAIPLGIKKIRITGGEPLVRKGIVQFLSELSRRKVDFSVTTNGILLSDFADDLKVAGVKRINVSLDTLSEKKFFEITRGGVLKKVINGIVKAKALGFNPIKINTVVLADTSEKDVKNFIDFAKTDGLILRFIEHLPFIGKEKNKFFDIEKSFQKKYNLIPTDVEGFGPGRHYKINGATVGFISALTLPFCRKCNRLRLTSCGKLMPCLSSLDAVDVKKAVRNFTSDDEIKNLFFEAVNNKPEKHTFENPRDCMNIKSMASIGG
ncbi:MAG: GTP 3',8-cyclase MoaA [Elusimicrobiota bacterium]|nr:GTP 3',8-cyclase MoaA [Elusimicrobiota bacterium]